MTREELAGDWAFPAQHTPEHTPGMTLRDYFAAKAMQAMTSNAETISVLARAAKADGGLNGFALTAQKSYEIADAMLEARK